MTEDPKEVHIDLLETDMKAGAHWLDPRIRYAHKRDAIRQRNRAKWLADCKAGRVKPSFSGGQKGK